MRSIKAMFLLSGGLICIGVAAGQQSVKDDVSDQTLRVQKIKADYQHSIDFLSNGIRHSWTVEDYRGAMGRLADPHQNLQRVHPNDLAAKGNMGRALALQR
jgi:hypothetical protein